MSARQNPPSTATGAHVFSGLFRDDMKSSAAANAASASSARRVQNKRVLSRRQRRDRTRTVACVTLSHVLQNARRYTSRTPVLQLFKAAPRTDLQRRIDENLVVRVGTDDGSDVAARPGRHPADSPAAPRRTGAGSRKAPPARPKWRRRYPPPWRPRRGEARDRRDPPGLPRGAALAAASASSGSAPDLRSLSPVAR